VGSWVGFLGKFRVVCTKHGFDPASANEICGVVLGFKHLNPPAGTNGLHVVVAMLDQLPVRRLTPRECERLQGFPDDYTLIPYRIPDTVIAGGGGRQGP
jgi:hypothetical protein